MVFHKVKSWAEQYEQHVLAGSLIVAFIFDNLTFRRVDLWFDNARLIFYLCFAAVGITIINLYEHGSLQGRFFTWLHRWLPAAVQFVFGGLFGGFFIFYQRSGSVFASWPFLVLLMGLFVGNEFLRKHYVRLSFQLSILFLTLYAFAIYFVPLTIGRLGDEVFLAAGFISLGIMLLFIYLLSRIVPARIERSKYILSASIGGIFILMNLLYFTNILPPIPLSLREADVYYRITRAAGGYLVTYEERPWYEELLFNPTLHILPGQPLYLYSAVFAPTGISTQVYHNWQYYDEAKQQWVSASRAHFTIVGGRDGGYRGYSLKPRLFPGKWRVNIETRRGQLIGRVAFTIEHVSQEPELLTETR